MQNNKVSSFTLSELLVVMIITVIVVGLAFSVLSLVQKQIHGIRKNFDKTTKLSLFEQRLWQDFNSSNSIYYFQDKLLLQGKDTIHYAFYNEYYTREKDTAYLQLKVIKTFLKGKQTNIGDIDAIKISAEKEIPNHFIFVTGEHDATKFINTDGL